MLVTNGTMVARVTMQELNCKTFTLNEDISAIYFHDDPTMRITQEKVVVIVEDLDDCCEQVQHWMYAQPWRRVKWEWIGALTWVQIHPELL